ncbi:MAG: molybdopterin-dependent oxidoreductase [Desulfobacterales bacterium]|nr:molybdopterin-dependent oxidoreductase [Desulfobacterales bacterium]
MKANAKQVKLTIDGHEITVDESLTILDAARQNGITIPTLCHHPALSNWGGCRLCVVEVDKSPKLVASCVMPVRAGMEVVTDNAAITASRRLTLTLLFAERNHNCMFCPQSGDCELQQMAYALQMDHLTVSQAFKEFPTDTTGEYMTVDHNRCILCGRCVRACQEIAGCHVLGFHNRGPKSIIGFDLLEQREDSTCVNCGACLQVCPTGAITNRYRTHYSVKGQPAEREVIASLCAGCGLLCPTQSVVRDNQLMEIKGFLESGNGRPDHGQLCHLGRFEVLKTPADRLLHPMIKDGNGRWHARTWQQCLELTTQRFKEIKQKQGAGALFGFASANISNEALLLFKELMVDGWGAGRVDTLDGDHFRALSAGHQGLPAEVSWKKITAADMVLLVGADLHQSHPMLVSLLRRAYIEKSLPVAVIGAMEGTAVFGAQYLAVEDERLPAVLGGLAAKIAARGQTASAQPDTLDPIAARFVAAKTPLILAGPQVTHPRAAAALGDLLKIAGQGASIAFLKPSVNSAAAWRLGVASQQPQAQAAGGGLLILGEEGSGALRSLLKGGTAPDFLAAITPYRTPALAEIAHVLLPRPLWLEEDGSYTSMEGGEIVYKPRVLAPPAGVKSTWETLREFFRCFDSPYADSRWDDVRAKADRILAACRFVETDPLMDPATDQRQK